MRHDSFSKQTKEDLSKLNIKKKCCRRSLYSALCYAQEQDLPEGVNGLKAKLEREFSSETLPENREEIFFCEECQRYYIRGLFLIFGTISDLKTKNYQLEMSLPTEVDSEGVCGILASYDISPLVTVRSGRTVLYLRDNTFIADFLNIIGAYKVSSDFINEKIKREFGSHANRRANCDVANISKAVTSAAEQVKAIEKLISNGMFESLSEPLKQTAKIRLENTEATLNELVALHGPGISKSGVNHRLGRIMEIYKKIGDS